MSADDTALLVVDVQEKLIGLVPGHKRLVWDIRRLLDGAKRWACRWLRPSNIPRAWDRQSPSSKFIFPMCLTNWRSALQAFGPLMGQLTSRGVFRRWWLGIEFARLHPTNRS